MAITDGQQNTSSRRKVRAYLIEFQKLLPLVLSDINAMFDLSHFDITNGKQVGFGFHVVESEVDGGWATLVTS